ncbi:hypothetical protein H8E52_03390 [bacterium]|nr:hypothetical protein [bacterium]
MGTPRVVVLTLLALILSSVSGHADQRTVLVELFGNIGCGFCADAEEVLHNLDMQYSDDELLIVEWHLSWPSWDPWNVANPDENEERRAFYNLWYIPAFRTDGYLPSNKYSVATHIESEYHDNGETPVHLEIEGEFDPDNSICEYRFKVETLSDLPEGDYALFAVLTEEVTYYNGAYYNTFHKSITDPQGWTVDEFPAELEGEFEFSGDAAGDWDPDECKIICWLQNRSDNKMVLQAESVNIRDLPSGDITGAPELALGFSLGAAYPNPFNPKTVLPIRIEEAGSLRLEILTADGRLVKQLHRGDLDSGSYEFTWDGLDERGQSMASGIYLARSIGSRGGSSQRLVLMK